MDYKLLENELKIRLQFDYFWGRKQTDDFDSATNFIYKVADFETLLFEIDSKFKSNLKYTELKTYALNRWFNFRSSQAVEHIFCSNNKVENHSNSKDKFIDFYIESIPYALSIVEN